MRHLIDTNACIALLNGTSPPLRKRLRRSDCLPLRRRQEPACGPQSRRLADRLEFEIVPFDAGDARAAGAVRSELEAKGLPIGPYDLLIAGQARARKLVLVTANSREFERVEGLVCEDWTLSGAGA